MKKSFDFRFYPSILDKYTKYVETNEDNFLYFGEDSEWHRNFNEEKGEYHYSPSEVEKIAKKELIDAINRIPFDSEAADKGTVLNELVDSFIHKIRSDKVKMRGDGGIIHAEYNCRTFNFSKPFVESIAEYFKGSMSQVFVSAPIETCYGIVEIYGYIDELRKNKVYDLKSTSNYTFGKYSKYWQRHAYPYCLLESGECTEIDSFEFTAYKLTGGNSRNPVISGVQYPEVYKYNHAESTELLRMHCERFIEFLIKNKELITDKKIFGGENE